MKFYFTKYSDTNIIMQPLGSHHQDIKSIARPPTKNPPHLFLPTKRKKEKMGKVKYET